MKYVELEKDYVVRSEREMKSKICRFFKEFEKHFGSISEFNSEYLQDQFDYAKEMKTIYDKEKAESISGCVSCKEYDQQNEDYEDGTYWHFLNKYDGKCWNGWDGYKDENGKKYTLSWDYIPKDNIGLGRMYIYYKQRVEE